MAGGAIEIYRSIEVITEHRVAPGRGVIVVDPAHDEGIRRQRRERGPREGWCAGRLAAVGGDAGAGCGPRFCATPSGQRFLAVCEELSDVVAI